MSNTKKRRLAVLLSGINEEYQRDILAGIVASSGPLNFDVYVFTSFGEGIHSHSHDLGEVNIFNLARLEDYDGVVLLSNTIQINAYTDELMARISTLKVPVIDIDHDTDAPNGFNISINNEKAMREIIEHMIVVHGFTRINFITGPSKNPEAAIRLKTYRDVLTAHGIPIEEERIFHGNFVRANGHVAIESFLSSKLPFPQAIISANDNMAIAAHICLVDHGIRVPEDVALSGFDNIEDARNLIPRLTTVSRPLFDVGTLCCHIIDDYLNGIDVPRQHFVESTPIFTGTCGCHEVAQAEPLTALYKSYNKNDTLTSFINDINHMSQSLTENAETDISLALKPYIRLISCDAFYVCLCEGWNRVEIDDDVENEYIIKGYSDYMTVALAYENSEYTQLRKFPTSHVVPCDAENEPPGNVYIMSPLHFGVRCFGYTITKNGDFPPRSLLYHSWLMNIANFLESNRRQLELRKMVAKLDELHIRDALTGLYNRRGFYRFASILFDNHLTFSIIFFDLDDFKLINDEHGHDVGDIALKSFATILGSYSSEKTVCARFGGDEFVMFCADSDEADTERICSEIEATLTAFNKRQTGEKSFALKTSYGACYGNANNKLTLNECIDSADGRMYKSKYMRKKAKETE